jgi:PPOX class probable F420-dependent enzyme
MTLPDRFIALMRGPNPCFITTLMPDGSPQTTETWVDTDGEHVIINTVQTHQKMRTSERDPRVSVAVCDADEPSRYYAIRGRVSNVSAEGGAEHIERLVQRYTGGPLPVVRGSGPGSGASDDHAREDPLHGSIAGGRCWSRIPGSVLSPQRMVRLERWRGR